jgi:hypothetical protein
MANGNAPYGVGQINRNTVGTAGNALASQQGSFSISELLGNRNVQQFLAQLGTQMGGAGETIGEPAQNLIQRQAMQEALSRGANVKLGADGSVNVTQPTQGAVTNQAGTGTGGATQQTGQGQQEETQGYDLGGQSLDSLVEMTLGNLGGNNR